MLANLTALEVLQRLAQERRPAVAEEQAVLARWSGWGAIPAVFDPERADLAGARARLGELLTEAEYAAARRSTINAHYTDAAIVAAVWAAVEQLGFTGGQVLEPGCGSGNFIGFAPPGARMIGVELDPTSAAIAAALYPDVDVRAESFAESRFADCSFDLTVGNVPFGRIALHDRRHNPGGHTLHNHFLIKSLHLTRPGGLVVAITSRYTLDARNPAARRELAGLADLVGAVRLPTDAHQRAAGTGVLTDLLVLRRLEPGRAGNGDQWERVAPVSVPFAPQLSGADPAEAGQVEVNQWFHDHPEQVLGAMRLGRGAHRDDELLVLSGRPLGVTLPGALERITTSARSAGLGAAPSAAADAHPAGRPVVVVGREGLIQNTDGGGFTRVVGGVLAPYAVPDSQAAELRALLGLRDTAVALLDAESATGEDTDTIAGLRARLGRQHTDYTKRWGPIKRCTWRRTGRTDPDSGEEKLARVRPAQGGFRRDPFVPLVRALECYDDVTGTATRAAIFTGRVVAPRAPRLGADSAEDALAICLDTHATVQLDEIARLLGITEDTARGELGDLVFDDPEDGRLVPAAEYLSGNVRTKLAAARTASLDDPRFAANVAALTAVIPTDLTPAEITVRLGAPWITTEHVQQFLRETLEDPGLRVEHPGGSIWAIRGAGHGVSATITWGTGRRPAPDIAQAALEQRVITVYDQLDDGTRMFNLTETLAAQEKARELGARFAEWVWEDPRRATELTRTYNDTFNAVVLRNYDDATASLPGIAVGFTPRPHQVAAVARMVNEPAVGLFHDVGAGKTAEMVMGAMELRRLGLVRKPAIVVPNHMLEQFATEFLTIYPRASILPAGRDDLAGERRREFVARVATGDWDAVILTRSAFERLPVRTDTQRAYLDRESTRLKAWIEQARAAGRSASLTIKRMEATLAAAEERLKQQLDTVKDPGLTFEATGIDYLVVDEAHDYKNLRTVSNIPGVAIQGANRATDLDMKIDLLRGRHGQRVVTLATATPIANSVAEAYTMQRYLRPDLLDAAGLTDFDCWAATFGEVVTGIELSPDGSRFRMKSRFARFRNVPELLRLWHVSADIKTADDLQLPTPLLAARADGLRAPETVVVEPSAELRDLVADLGRRADTVKVRAGPGADNMLKIATDGRLAALDLRLVGTGTDAATKLDVAADRIADIWRAHRQDTYPGPDGDEHPRAGALQLVFSDLGTPNEHRWDVYHELRDLLHRRGMPAGSVRFVHEARNDLEKATLFAAAREGRIAVLVGSTQRMGVGTNVQLRAIALHHLDCPWRPADLAQRDGRILRQGNHNPEVQILRYVTECSFDAYSWQTVTRKAAFIGQVMRGRLDVREMEDIGDTALSYDEVKALATGDPRVLEKARLDAEVARLERLERAHHRNQGQLGHSIRDAEQIVDTLTMESRAVADAIARRLDSRGEAFRAIIGDTTYVNRADAGRAILATLTGPGAVRAGSEQIGVLAGFPLQVGVDRVGDIVAGVTITLDGVPRGAICLRGDELSGTDPAGLVTRIENRIAGLDRLARQLDDDIAAARREADRARAQQGQPFAHAERIAAARATAADLQRQMNELATSPARSTTPADHGAAADPPTPRRHAERRIGVPPPGIPRRASPTVVQGR